MVGRSGSAIRVALDAEPIGRDGSGNDRYLAGLVGGLTELDRPEIHLCLITPSVGRLAHLDASALTIRPTRPGLFGQVAWARDAMAAGAQVAIGNYLPPIGFRGVRLTIFHDVAWRRVPSAFPRLMVPRLEATAWLALHLSDVVVTSSRFSRDEMRKLFPRARNTRFAVVPGAASTQFGLSRSGSTEDMRARLGLPDEFVLAVGNLHPRKNLKFAMAACREAEVPLVIAGRPIWGSTIGLDDPWTRWLGHVSDDDLCDLYRECLGLVYPSLYEGFGLPIVEAMASGAPVLCSNRGSLPEVAGDAAFLFDPTDISALVSGLKKLRWEPGWRLEMRRRSIERASEYSWKSSASILMNVIEDLARQ